MRRLLLVPLLSCLGEGLYCSQDLTPSAQLAFADAWAAVLYN
jgi:hypothetical protein